MGENLRPYIPMEDGCRNESARAHSVESGVTVDGSWEEVSSPVADASSLLTQWTEDMHNSYIDCLERSFVERLHHSRRLRGWLSPRDSMGSYPPDELPAVNCDSPEQFAVVQNGCPQRMSFERNEKGSESTSGFHSVEESQWICQLPAGSFSVMAPLDPLHKSSPEMHGRQNLTLSSKLQSNSREHHACHLLHPNVAGDISEYSDQNFEDEKDGEKLCCAPLAKRMRTSIVDAFNIE